MCAPLSVNVLISASKLSPRCLKSEFRASGTWAARRSDDALAETSKILKEFLQEFLLLVFRDRKFLRGIPCAGISQGIPGGTNSWRNSLSVPPQGFLAGLTYLAHQRCPFVYGMLSLMPFFLLFNQIMLTSRISFMHTIILTTQPNSVHNKTLRLRLQN